MKTNNIRKLSKKVISGNSRLINNKKAVSEIITTVLIILISLSAVIILGIIINKTLKNPALSPETSCPILLSKNIISIASACYNANTNETMVKLQRNSEEININKLSFIFNSRGEDSETFSCSSECTNCQILSKDTIKTYYFSNNKTEKVILRINNCVIETKDIKDC